MKIGDTPPPLRRRVSNPRIRADRALHELFSNSDKVHRAIYDAAYTQAWFDYIRSSIFSQSVRKISKDVELFNVSAYQCSIFFNSLVSFNRKSEFRKPENLNKPITWGENLMSLICLSSRNFRRNNYAHLILTAEADSLPTDTRQLLWRLWLGGIPLSQRQWSVSPRKNGFHWFCSLLVGIKWRGRQIYTCRDFWCEVC